MVAVGVFGGVPGPGASGTGRHGVWRESQTMRGGIAPLELVLVSARQGGGTMVPEVELWSPEQELRLLEELAETEASAFDLDLGLPAPVATAEPEQAWVAYWQLPPNGLRAKSRSSARHVRGR